MKKRIISALCFLLGAAVGIGCFILFDRVFTKEPGPDDFSSKEVMVLEANEGGSYRNSELVDLAYSVLTCLRDNDYKTLSKYVHPEYGLIMSPYSTINLSSNQCYMPGKVTTIGDDKEVYVWGTVNGTDEPIQMTAKDYFAAYVYDHDYLSAPVIGINRIIKSGNSLENVTSIFPEGEFVDFYIPPVSAESMDWYILRLVFENSGGSLKLSAIIHSQYTV